MKLHSPGSGMHRAARSLSVFAAACGLACLSLSTSALAAGQQLPGHIPSIVAKSALIGNMQPNEVIAFTLALPIRNDAQLEDLLQRLYDPNDPQYGKYLTADQFTAQFGPTQADYTALVVYARAQGFTIDNIAPNRLILNVSGPVQKIEAAFGVKMKQYKDATGRVFRAPDSNPTVPASLTGKIQGIIGLDTAAVMHMPHHIVQPNQQPNLPANPLAFLNPPASPSYKALALPPVNGMPSGKPNPTQALPTYPFGSGPSGGYTPSDIKTAYNLNSVTQTGAGQTLGLFEIGGSYDDNDVITYEDTFNLPHMAVQKVLVDGFSGRTGGGADVEVQLDIDMQIAMAPGASKILVYEGIFNGDFVKNSIDVYNRMATDNLAKSVSVSYGTGEDPARFAQYITTGNIFRQMAAQGQSVFISSGDSGAFDRDNITLIASDPASQPYVTAVGGTTMITAFPGGPIFLETTWNEGLGNGAGGGGISLLWPMPGYQLGTINARATRGSAIMRNIPDVSLNADSFTGYDIYLGAYGGWFPVGGTSASAPLWAGFAALVNQKRAQSSLPTLGFANPAIYSIGKNTPRSTSYAQDFFDIADNSDNLFYPAVTGLDLATGWGTIRGVSLLNDLASLTVATPATPGTSAQLLGNPGFENGAKNQTPWIASVAVINNVNGKEFPHDGAWKAWLGGHGAKHTDTLYQDVTVTAGAASATLNFFMMVDIPDPANPIPFAYDNLTVQIRDANNTVLRTLGGFSNLDYSGGAYILHKYDLTRYAGQKIRIFVTGTDNGGGTSFVMDDFGLVAVK